jgi:class 3 adenylate cyclase
LEAPTRSIGKDGEVDHPPDTRYVAVGDADVAYQIVGDGPIDLLYFAGLGTHIDLLWDYPPSTTFFSGLASFARLILFDRRGTGASDAVPHSAIPTWEAWSEDVRAVLDAAGSQRAAIFAELDAGPIAILFAATHPERLSGLILANTSARFLRDDDYPAGLPAESVDALVEIVNKTWGTPMVVRGLRPDADPELIRWNTKLLRAAATPRNAAAQYRYILSTLDVRSALPLVQAPTLVLHSRGHPFFPLEHGRYLASRIPGAQFVELQSDETYFSPRGYARVTDEVSGFLTGERPPVEIDRVLTTLLLTDIVKSTEHAATLGDRRWRTALDAHDRMVRGELRRFRGQEIKTTGDGFFASFDGPGRAIRCARSIIQSVGPLGIQVRTGLHTGECEIRGDDLGGLTVHIAARVRDLAGGGEVLATSTVKDLAAGSGIEFADRGDHELRGVPGTWRLFSVPA